MGLVYMGLQLFDMEVEKSQTEWSAEDNLTAANKWKQEGNSHFKNKNLKQALKAYHKAILHLAGIIGKSSSVAMYTTKVASEDLTNSANELKFNIYNNMAQIYIAQNKYDRGLQILAKAKEIKTNAKFYYRRAICLMRVSQFDQAKADINTLVNLDPSFRQETEKMLQEMTVLEKKQDEKAKAVYKNFFK